MSKLKKYPKVKTPEDVEGIVTDEPFTYYIQEKIDGANARFTITDNHRVLFGSRNVEFKEHGRPQFTDEMNKQFRHAYKYVSNNVDREAFKETEETYGSVTVFGESLHKHSIDYDAWEGKHPDVDSDTPNFLAFDIYTEQVGWLNPERVAKVCEDIGLETVPVIGKIKWKDLDLENIQIPQSEYRTEHPDGQNEFDRKGLAEGVVIKNMQNQSRAKVVHEQFKETKNPSSSKSNNGSNNDEEEIHEFAEKYVTKARVEKIAHKLIDKEKYESLQMSMMEDLKDDVYQDAINEAHIDDLSWYNRKKKEEKVYDDVTDLTARKLSQIVKQQ